MKSVAGSLMSANAAFFFFGCVQHAGVAVGRFHEPLIIPAAIVETLCGLRGTNVAFAAYDVLRCACYGWERRSKILPFLSPSFHSTANRMRRPPLLVVAGVRSAADVPPRLAPAVPDRWDGRQTPGNW